MGILDKAIESINEDDLQALIDSQIRESKSIEYKELLPGGSDSEKKEFLADVSSFANASGGHLIYGMRAKDGVPTGLSGLNIDPDGEILRLETMIRTGIEERIPGLKTQTLKLRNSNYLIIIRIPKSWILPHRVIFKDHSKFYSRNSAGKYALDVSELRGLFTLSETTMEQIRNFRDERLLKIYAGETPVPLWGNHSLMLHLIPLNAFHPETLFDLSSLPHKLDQLGPICHRGVSYRFNLEGFLTFTKSVGKKLTYTYLQVFRNGSIEAVDQSLLAKDEDADIPQITTRTFEKELMDSLKEYLTFQKNLGVSLPILTMLSLIGVKGYELATDLRFHHETHFPIDRDNLILPEVIVDNFEADPSLILKPIFDTIWNACGYSRAMTYDQDGKRL